MQEPIRWTNFLLFMNNKMLSSPILTKITPILADVFLFTYPAYLVTLYLYGIIKKKIEYKIWSVFIFFTTWVSICLNIFTQLFFDKQRPNIVLWWLVDKKVESVLHKFLPSSSFPSDHAIVSFTIATATLMYWIHSKNKFYKRISILFYAFATVMSFSRITIWVHRTTDIIAWAFLWCLVPIILIQKNIFWLLDKYILQNLVKIEENILSKFLRKN